MTVNRCMKRQCVSRARHSRTVHWTPVWMLELVAHWHSTTT